MAETAEIGLKQAPTRALFQFSPEDSDHPAPGMADSVLGAVGAKLVNTARALKQKTGPRGSSGVAIPFILALEDAGFFLQGRPAENLFYETGNILRRRPIPFMLIGATLGFLLARGTRR